MDDSTSTGIALPIFWGGPQVFSSSVEKQQEKMLVHKGINYLALPTICPSVSCTVPIVTLLSKINK